MVRLSNGDAPFPCALVKDGGWRVVSTSASQALGS